MKKRAVTILISASMLFTTAAFANEAPEPEVISANSGISSYVPSSLRSMLTVSEKGEGYIIGKTDEGTELRLNLSENTVIIDSVTALPLSALDIKEGDVIFAEYSEAMTRSLPPQSSAYFIAANTDKGGAVNLINVSEIKKNEDGSIAVTDSSKQIIVTISKDALVSPYKTRNIVTLDDITVGSSLLAWYDIVALSLPGQSHTDKVVLLPIKEAPSTSEDSDKDGLLNGVVIANENCLNRSEFTNIVYNLLNSNGLLADKNAEDKFNDVTDNRINLLASCGIVSGRGDKIFAPDDRITKEEAYVIACRAAKLMGIEIPEVKERASVSGIENVSDWALSSILGLNSLNLIPNDENTFNPKGDVTSSEALYTLSCINALKISE